MTLNSASDVIQTRIPATGRTKRPAKPYVSLDDHGKGTACRALTHTAPDNASRWSPNWCSLLVMGLVLLLSFHSVSFCSADQQVASIETQVLRVFTVKNSGYYHKPWKSPDFANVKGSAFFFEDEKIFPGKKGLILTNAHAVSMAQSIKVSNGREKRRYDVKPIIVCDSADFAVLQMDEKELETYEDHNGKVVPLQLGDSDMLRIGDKVLGWGFPLGGERLSKSEQGEISRIEVSRYVYSQDQWLMVQASLQQNRGNSGGPVLMDGKAVGIAFQGMQTSDRINYFIPINLVKHLVPLLPGNAVIPQWDWLIQHLFPGLKDYYSLDKEQGGVLLAYTIPGGGPYKFGLRTNDILVQIDGHEIDNFGEVFFKPLGQNVFFGEILNRKRAGDPLTLKIIREGKAQEISGNVPHGLPRLVPRIFTKANYFIYGGIGFVELTLNCIDNLGKSGETFRSQYVDEFPKLPHQKIVIVSEIFPEYGLVDTAPFLKRVEKVDGEDVLNIAHLYSAIQSAAKQGKKRLLLQIRTDVQLPVDLEKAAELDRQIQEKYGILYMKTPGDFTE
ncbi:MAG: trypsin-like peptidase domain-containing protein [Desulfomonile tiedjei]|nr:trypsin-like peptidase domain-containing protein [Desulfomonile tiedjei]